MNNFEDRLKKGLENEAARLPDPEPRVTTTRTRPVPRRWLAAALTAAAVVAGIGGFALLAPGSGEGNVVGPTSPTAVVAPEVPSSTTSTTEYDCSTLVGIHPPASIEFVGDTVVSVPFQFWGCSSIEADNFIEVTDYQVTASSSILEIVATHQPGDELVVSTTLEGSSEPITLLVDETEQTVRVTLPEGVQTVAVRIETPDGRKATYFVHATSGNPSGYTPAAEETWLLETLASAGFDAEIAQANQTGPRAEAYIDMSDLVQVFVTSQPKGTPPLLAESTLDRRVALSCGDRDVFIEADWSWNFTLEVAIAVAGELSCTGDATVGLWPIRTFDEIVEAADAGGDEVDHEAAAEAFVRLNLGWSEPLELGDVFDGTDSMGFKYAIGDRDVFVGTETIYLDNPVTIVTTVSTMLGLGETAAYLSASVRESGDLWTASFGFPSASELQAQGRPAITSVRSELRYGEEVYVSEDGTADFTLKNPPVIPGLIIIEYRDAAGAIVDYVGVMIPPGPFAAG